MNPNLAEKQRTRGERIVSPRTEGGGEAFAEATTRFRSCKIQASGPDGGRISHCAFASSPVQEASSRTTETVHGHWQLLFVSLRAATALSDQTGYALLARRLTFLDVMGRLVARDEYRRELGTGSFLGFVKRGHAAFKLDTMMNRTTVTGPTFRLYGRTFIRV
ncbi:hypothetical protein K0M31_007396 [Melipona bicolor]|uniref:Uncharacterized protein n=1 Tax=Melipona bicolor TaxID=60889 RepID=A0AA40GBE4_9HYME|nr:hypothetical protein K0M31_007396 [Melipona bicolor]